MVRLFLGLAAVLAGLSVAAGAFASHALKPRLTERAIAIFETAARYQMYHALALALVALLLLLRPDSPTPTLVTAGSAFILGILLFSGSLYGLSLTGISWLGAITPIGGAAFLGGWLALAIAAWNWQG